MRAPRPFLVAAVAALGLVQTLAPAAAAAKSTTPRGSCFHARSINGYTTGPDDRTVYLRVGVRDVYRLDLFGPCPEIDWSHSIALRARGSSWICEGGGAIGLDVFAPSVTGPNRCPVTAIRKLRPEEVAALPRKYRP